MGKYAPIPLYVSMTPNGDWTVIWSTAPGKRISVTIIGNPGKREAIIERSRLVLDHTLSVTGKGVT